MVFISFLLCFLQWCQAINCATLFLLFSGCMKSKLICNLCWGIALQLPIFNNKAITGLILHRAQKGHTMCPLHWKTREGQCHTNRPGFKQYLKSTLSVYLMFLKCRMGGVCSILTILSGSINPDKLIQAQIQYLKWFQIVFEPRSERHTQNSKVDMLLDCQTGNPKSFNYCTTKCRDNEFIIIMNSCLLHDYKGIVNCNAMLCYAMLCLLCIPYRALDCKAATQ